MKAYRYSTYCPKVICSIGNLMDVLEDRSFEIILLKTLNREISGTEASQSSKEWQPIRDELYLCLMQHWKEVQTLAESLQNELSLPGRVWNISKPLLVIARLIDSYDSELKVEASIKGFLNYQISKKLEKAQDTLAASILNALESILLAQNLQANYPYRVEVNEVLEKVRENEGDSAKNAEGEYWIKTRHITGPLKNLQLYQDPKRDGPKGRFRFTITIQDVNQAKQRLSIDSTEATEATEPPEAKRREGDEASSSSVPNAGTLFSASGASVGSVGSVNEGT